MLFNSFEYLIFLPTVFLLYWFVFNKYLNLQNAFLLIVSYVFYGWWDWRFLSLIVFSSAVDYITAKLIYSTGNINRKKYLLWFSLSMNLGVLTIFKYFDFFVENLESIFSLFGSNTIFLRMDIVLPVGISFYTFQTMSYTIDVYRNRMKPSFDPYSFFAYVSFFPQLVAGPIERATNLLPQFRKNRSFDYSMSVNGLRQILWGLFKKMVIADNCAIYVDMFFAEPSLYSGSTLLLGAIFFAFQIYGDFSGYSDIAIGTGKLFGFNLKQNFAFPYFSRDIAEFWRRWHISLSSWFRDYLYIPLGGSRGGKMVTFRNVFIVFIVCGFWHGANWTFIVWGLLNAALYIPLYILDSNRNNIEIVAIGKSLPSITQFLSISLTFSITVFLWIIFRSESISQAILYVSGIFDGSILSIPDFEFRTRAFTTSILILFFLIIEWLGRTDQYALERLGLSKSRWIRWAGYSFLVFLIGMYSATEETPFIYFQF